MSDLAPSWQRRDRLRAFTPARVGLGLTGVSLHTRDVLAFQLCHAQARDAVHARFDAGALAAALAVAAPGRALARLHSAAPDRATYLQRPDLGRRLDESSTRTLTEFEPAAHDLVVIIADGLSALAVERHAPLLLKELLPPLNEWSIAPICVVEQGRVAIGDEIGALLQADLSVILIGERPGLSSPDSLGAYITWHPRAGRTDAERSCISNIRHEGLDYMDAAGQIVNCLRSARRHRVAGTALAETTRRLGDGGPNGRQA